VPLIDQQVTSRLSSSVADRATSSDAARGMGGLIGDDQAIGWDVRRYVNAKLSPAGVARSNKSPMSAQDEQILSANVSMTVAAAL